MNGEVYSINISTKKGTIKKPVENASITSIGIDGDAHSGTWHRQITLMSKERIADFSKELGRDITPGEFAENITTSGIDLTQVKIFDRFFIGRTELEVTQIGKSCHGDKCAIFREIGKCIMPHEGIFCRVITGGKVKPGDKVAHLKKSIRFAIVTVSDRASRGEYEDLSGPAINKVVSEYFKDKPYNILFHNVIMSDDARNLREELVLLSENGFDVIITTGGTGIGPRDNTVDIAKKLISKEIPGIMEFIRCKYGAKFPNALLSRSIAGVASRALLYTLPGSVKAAKEYTEEIVKTIPHSLFMLKGIDNH